MLEHINRHQKNLASDIRALGWFWGTMRDIMKRKPLMTIAEALGEGDVSKCRQNKCGHVFATADSLRRHFSHAHASPTMQNWDAKMRQMVFRWEIVAPDERREAQREDGHKRTTKGKKKLSQDTATDQTVRRHQRHGSHGTPRRRLKRFHNTNTLHRSSDQTSASESESIEH
jgi:hypothetical protein